MNVGFMFIQTHPTLWNLCLSYVPGKIRKFENETVNIQRSIPIVIFILNTKKARFKAEDKLLHKRIFLFFYKLLIINKKKKKI